MADQITQLAVSLEARTTALEKSMARALKVSGDTMNAIDRRAKQTAKTVEDAFANDNTRKMAEGVKLTGQEWTIHHYVHLKILPLFIIGT